MHTSVLFTFTITIRQGVAGGKGSMLLMVQAEPVLIREAFFMG